MMTYGIYQHSNEYCACDGRAVLRVLDSSDYFVVVVLEQKAEDR